MKKHFFLFIYLCFAGVSFSQIILDVNFDKIKQATQDSLSPYYYPNLTTRFLKFDDSFGNQEYYYLYYGSVFLETYNPYGKGTFEKEFLSLYKEKNYSEAISIGEKELKENPANLPLIYKIYASYYFNQEKEMAKLYANHYLSLLNVIYNSGDGKSEKTAYVVVAIKDEYEILADLNLTRTGQALLKSFTDVLFIETKGQRKQKGQKKIKELYFNIEIPFKSLAKMFNAKNLNGIDIEESEDK